MIKRGQVEICGLASDEIAYVDYDAVLRVIARRRWGGRRVWLSCSRVNLGSPEQEFLGGVRGQIAPQFLLLREIYGTSGATNTATWCRVQSGLIGISESILDRSCHTYAITLLPLPPTALHHDRAYDV